MKWRILIISIIIIIILGLLINTCSKIEDTGEKLYIAHCSGCHFESGKGLVGVIPPLNNSDFVKTNLHLIPCFIKQGIRESITVNKIIYLPSMPSFPLLTIIEITNIVNFLNNKWGDKKALTANEVEKILENCK